MTRVRALLAAIALALLLVAFSGERFWLQFLGKAMITCIFAMSLDLLVGVVGQVSLAHATFYGLSAYLLAGLSNRWELTNPLLTLPLCLAFAASAALVIGWLSLRASGAYFIMVTLAFTQMFYYLASDAPWFGGSDGLYVNHRPSLGQLDFGSRQTAYVAIWIAAICVYGFLRQLLRAPFGKVLTGIRGNEQRMRSLGYAAGSYKLAAFVLAGALAGLAGYLDATLYGFVNPAQFSWRQSGLLLMTVLLGGRGTFYGPILGALVLTFVTHYGEQLTSHYNAIIGALVIAVVLFLPGGLAQLLRGSARG